MNQLNQFAQIGEGSDGGAVAIRLRLSDIVDEFEDKVAAIPTVIEAFNKAELAVRSAAVVQGSWGGQVFSRDPSIDERQVRKSLLCSAWRHVYEGLNIENIASAKDRKRLELMLENPPAFNMENIADQYGEYILDQRFHILKGLAECFCDLDPAYKSHSKVKIGVEGLPKRIIIPYVSGWKSWGRERLQDTLNALRVFRGQKRYEYREFEDMMTEAKKYGEADFCSGRVKRFANGNAHLIFGKQGLLDINRALAEFYGDVLPDAPSDAEARRPSTEVARDLQFYWSPPKVVEEIIGRLDLRGGEHVLEPSCGDGRIMDRLASWHLDPENRYCRSAVTVTGIEYDAGRAETARAKGHSVMTANFLQVAPDPRFDRVVLNPPFYGKHYRKHADHAIRFLKLWIAAIVFLNCHYASFVAARLTYFAEELTPALKPSATCS